MKGQKNKLPSKTWRVISFIPAINWLSLLYIGLTNSNAVNVICAIAYGVLSFIFPTISALLWVAGIIHYALAYRNLKSSKTPSHYEKDFPFPENTPRNPSAQPRASSSSNRVINSGFADVDISGEMERREAIPNPSDSAPFTVHTQISYTYRDPHQDFYHSMQEYAALEGEPAPFTPFMSYWPTYESMDREQRAWYFYWRSEVRRERYPDTDLSYIFVYTYELLSGIGWNTPLEGYTQICSVWSAYQEAFPKLEHYLMNWTFDFAQLHNLPYQIPFVGNRARSMQADVVDVLVQQHAEDVPIKLPFVLIDALCDYSLVNSKFYKEGHQDLMQEAIPRVVALADAALLKKTGKGILASYGPNRPRKRERTTFQSALCPQAHQKLTISVKAYASNQRLRTYINELGRIR